MKVKVVSRKLVKPRTPTPENLRNYHISFMDELNPTMNVNAILYYTNMNTNTNTTSEMLNRLEESLAQVLPLFYPFAGRYMKKDHSVDCSDQGAELVVANVELELLHVIDGAAPTELNDLIPLEYGAADEETDPILSIQVNKFMCGGIAIAICISHRIVDASSLGTFISAWTNASRGDVDGAEAEAVRPSFDGPKFFPGKNYPAPEFGTTRTRENSLYNIGCKIFKFNKNEISRLKARAAAAMTGESRPPSRNQVISGLMISAIAGADRAKHGRATSGPRDLLVVQAVNMRGRTAPPLPTHSCGNLVALSITECSGEQTGSMGFVDFVRLLRDDARKTVRDCGKFLSEEGHKKWIDISVYASEKSESPDVNVVWLTDWTKFGFYDADFGFGKPVWASVVDVFIKNHVTMMSTKEGDGVEAWVQLEEAEMPHFEHQINDLLYV